MRNADIHDYFIANYVQFIADPDDTRTYPNPFHVQWRKPPSNGPAMDMRSLLMSDIVAVIIASVGNDRRGLGTGSFCQIPVVRGIEDAAAVFGTEEGQENDIGVNTAHEDADDDTVLVTLGLALGGKGETFADGGFDGRGGGRDEVAELIRGPDDEGAEGAGRQFHEMDGDDAPGTLHAELLKKGGRDDALVRDESVWVQKRTTEDTDGDDGKATAEYLRRVADECSACHGTKVGHHLSDGDCIWREIVLVGQHRRIQILRSV